MSLWESFRHAIRLLASQPLRSVLTLFGLVWGTAAVIFLMSWGAGLNQMLDISFNRIGKNLLMVFPGRVSEDYSPAFDRRFLFYERDDVDDLRSRAHEIDLVAGETQKWMASAFGSRALSVDTRGVEPEGIRIRGVGIESGRSLRRADLDHRRRVAILGNTARELLLGSRGSVGSWIRLDGTPFRVVGVLERVGTQLSRDGDEIDRQIWVPLTTHMGLWPNPFVAEEFLPKLLIRVRDRHRFAEAKAEVRSILSERLRVSPSDEEATPMFGVNEILDELPIGEQNTVSVLIAAMTLVIGGVGVLSMMLDSVRERRAEIGIRLAVGARRRDILGQFFIETVAIVGLGGLLGVLIGVGGTLLLGSDVLRDAIPSAQRDLVPLPILEPHMIATAVGIMCFVALAAAIVPAWRASRVDPAETLRWE